MVTLTTREASPVAVEVGEEDLAWVLAVGRPTTRVSPGLTVLEALRQAGATPPTSHQVLRVANGTTSEEVKDPASRVLGPRERLSLVNKVVGGV